MMIVDLRQSLASMISSRSRHLFILKDLPSEERLARHQATIKQLVDALFAYLKQHENEVGADKCLCRIWWTNRDIFGGQYEAHEPAK